MKNIADLQDLFLWTLVIQDWEAVDVLLVRMEDYFTSPHQREIWGRWAALSRYSKRSKQGLVMSEPKVTEGKGKQQE